MKRVFLTGATGFLGQNLLDVLLQDGQWTVIAFVRTSSNTAALDARGVQHVVGDLDDPVSIAAAMPDGVDVVIHAAANLSTWWPNDAMQWQDNVAGTKAVCDAALTKHAKRFVLVSSVASYGLDGTFTEDLPQEGHLSCVHYARTKYAAEQHVRAAIKCGLNAVIVNPAHLLGPFDKTGWARMFIMIAHNKLDGIPPGSGSFAYAPCVAKTIVDVASGDCGRVGHNYLLGGANATFRDVIVSAATRLGKHETRAPLPRWLFLTLGWCYDWYAYLVTSVEPPITYGNAFATSAVLSVDSAKAKIELGYETPTLDAMLQHTLAWLEAQHML
ncbi:Aste57867_16112 [Aphanomyces stellatus]|uniref:Aste57867_16112 protein n=1 Tax=Aphanomyces stellatus TaxID=120398 RepID=A0A485L4W1_9STRA|nr:hypothetical protein As57867_016056 [Aphanomyces stellatus]VFT92895.1 Aste57867_16112 [Aphanomyces stellatus]